MIKLGVYDKKKDNYLIKNYNNISMNEKNQILIEVPIIIKKEKNYYEACASNKFISYGKNKEKVLSNIKEAFKLNRINENVEYSFKLLNDSKM